MNGKSKILIPLAIVIGALLISGTIFYLKKGERGVLPPEKAAQKAIDFINQNKEMFGIEGMTASLVNVTEESGLYKIKLKIGEREYDSYVTKNGKLFFAFAIPLTNQNNQTVTQEIEKRERPDVKLFVMSYCPFGLQMEKAYLPVYNLLKDKVDMGIYFVDYIMHEKKEIDENLRQYCIQKEQKEKYYDYLNCFVKEGSYENFEVYKECLKKANIDEIKLENCISQTDKDYKITELYNDKSTWLNGRYPQFNVHKDLNDKYGVRGSPTILINDTVIVTTQRDCPGGNVKCAVISNFNRSPEKFKELVCQAFKSPPTECSQKLPEETASSGFGLSSGSSSQGSCQ